MSLLDVVERGAGMESDKDRGIEKRHRKQGSETEKGKAGSTMRESESNIY